MLAVTASALVILGEAFGIALYYRVSPLLVLESTFTFDLDMIRPGWLVLGAGLCVVGLHLVQIWRHKKQPARPIAPAPHAAGVQEPA
jgi:sulfoxide reductase heme-binding subunit YedZ